MDIEKFTQKSQEAVNGSHSLAVENNHQEITPQHLFLALLKQENSLASTIIEKTGSG